MHMNEERLSTRKPICRSMPPSLIQENDVTIGLLAAVAPRSVTQQAKSDTESTNETSIARIAILSASLSSHLPKKRMTANASSGVRRMPAGTQKYMLSIVKACLCYLSYSPQLR